jgi:hypothetical protein
MPSVVTKLWSTKLVSPRKEYVTLPVSNKEFSLVIFAVKLSSFTEFSSNMQFLHDQHKLAPYYNSAKAE